MEIKVSPSVDSLRWLALLTVTAIISVAFLGMVQPFVMPLALAAIGAAMSAAPYRWFEARLGGRKALAAGATLCTMTLVVIAPLMWLVYAAASQAAGLGDEARALIDMVEPRAPGAFLPEWVPFRAMIVDSWPQILAKLAELGGAAAGFFAQSLGAAGAGAAAFFLDLFVFFFALFFFVQMDEPPVKQILRLSGLKPETQNRLHDRMLSISRATLKGSLLIGIAQGALGGIGFWVAGIEGAVFWGFVMAVMSVIPGIGAAGVVVCGAIYLVTQGQMTEGVALAVWGMAVVGTIDNLLRPILVGRDAKMHDILILIGTLGGLASFGVAGLVAGPVLAGLFVTVWTSLNERAGIDTEEDAPPDALEDAPPEDAPPEDAAAPGPFDDDPALVAQIAELRRRHDARQDPAG